MVNKGCPYNDTSLEGQIQFEHAQDDWVRKNRTQYDSVMTYLEKERGLIKENKRVTHKDDNLVLTYDLKKGCSGTIIEITIKDYEVGTYIGVNNVLYPDTNVISSCRAYGFKIKAADASGKEVDGSTKVEIQFFDPFSKMYSSSIPSPHYTIYKNVCGKHGLLFKFEKHGLVDKFKQQRWRLINPDVDVVAQNVEYYGVWDLWSKAK